MTNYTHLNKEQRSTIEYLINLNKKKEILPWIYPKYWYAIIFAVILVIYGILRNLV